MEWVWELLVQFVLECEEKMNNPQQIHIVLLILPWYDHVQIVWKVETVKQNVDESIMFFILLLVMKLL